MLIPKKRFYSKKIKCPMKYYIFESFCIFIKMFFIYHWLSIQLVINIPPEFPNSPIWELNISKVLSNCHTQHIFSRKIF